MALIFDFDSTLINDESLVSLLTFSLQDEGKGPEYVQQQQEKIEEITNLGISGKIDMITSYSRRLAIAKPTIASVNKYIGMAQELVTKGMPEVLTKFSERFPHVPIYIVSQGPLLILKLLSAILFPQIKQENIFGVDLDIQKGMETGNYVPADERVLKIGKTEVARDIVKKMEGQTGKKVHPVVIVGDGVSDMRIRQEGVATTGIGFGVHKQFEKTKQMSDFFITNPDMMQEFWPLLVDIYEDKKYITEVRKREETINFFSGPAAVPTQVLQKMSNEMLNFQGGLGMSILECSHRDPVFTKLLNDTKSNLRQLLDIPADYEILFTQGGASMHFSAIPMNLLPTNNTACNYVLTGAWSNKAHEEAGQYSDIIGVSASATSSPKVSIPDASTWNLGENAAYTYYCDNETIQGLEFPDVPSLDLSKSGPLVSDMSSNLLSRPINWSKGLGLVYSCAQKNFGLAGLVIVIIRKDLLGKARKGTPSMLNYKVFANSNSLENTPPTYAIYAANLIFKWTIDQGGVAMMHQKAVERSSKLYQYIDSSKIYKNNVDTLYRSRMNVVFTIQAPGKQEKENRALEAKFVEEAAKQGIIGIGGHRSVGGMRASLYNAATMQSVDRLLQFMRSFEEQALQ